MFTDLLKDATELWDVRVAAYCKMSNYYYLLIHTPKGSSRDARGKLTVFINSVSTDATVLMDSCFVAGLSRF